MAASPRLRNHSGKRDEHEDLSTNWAVACPKYALPVHQRLRNLDSKINGLAQEVVGTSRGHEIPNHDQLNDVHMAGGHHDRQ